MKERIPLPVWKQEELPEAGKNIVGERVYLFALHHHADCLGSFRLPVHVLGEEIPC